jgi:hypothetical protein
MVGGVLVTRRPVQPLLDVDRAQVSQDPDGSITVDDPHAPWIVRVWVVDIDGRACIDRMQVEAREPGMCITAARLGRLPTAQILQVAAAEMFGQGGEIYYRMLARPRSRGSRSWDRDHYVRVLAVHDWAMRTRRPGGGAQAVADLWGIAKNPTAWRWLAAARKTISS